MASTHFLQLPAELRLKILEELLFRSEPLVPRPVPCSECALVVPKVAVYTHLFSHKPQKQTLGLYTEILRTCRQLSNEGTPVLYANTAAVEAWLEDRLSGAQYSRMSIGFALHDLHNGLQHQAKLLDGLQTPLSNVRLTVRTSWHDDNARSSYQSLYDKVAVLLESTKQLRQLHIRIIIPLGTSDVQSESRSEHSGLIVRWLRRIDSISRVRVTRDLPEPLAAQLSLNDDGEGQQT